MPILAAVQSPVPPLYGLTALLVLLVIVVQLWRVRRNRQKGDTSEHTAKGEAYTGHHRQESPEARKDPR